jgi:hypothetical protein
MEFDLDKYEEPEFEILDDSINVESIKRLIDNHVKNPRLDMNGKVDSAWASLVNTQLSVYMKLIGMDTGNEDINVEI